MRLDEGLLLCDFAETYHIYNIWEYRPSYIALLAIGLRDNSRIKMKWSGLKQPLLCVLMAQAVDSLATLVWMNTEDGINGVNRPTMISPTMIDGQIKEKSKTGYDTPEEFMEAMRKYEGGEQG